MGRAAAGEWLAYLVSIDAVLVLSGAVLTAYVGVTGLSRRLALDRILAQFLLQENKLRRTNHWIIIGFFLLCTSLFFIVDAKTDTLSGVYTSAFLCVMAMFAVGNMMLKYKRSRLPRESYTPWPVVVVAFFGVVAAFIANAIFNTAVLLYFVIYFGGTMFLFMLMFWRIRILKIVLYFCKILTKRPTIHNALERKIQELNSSKVIFFCRDDNIALVNKALLYIRDNEQTNWVIIVHVYKRKEDIAPKLEENC
jgi:amino acid transporter